MIKKVKIFIIITGITVFISSCSTVQVSLTSSSTPLHNKVIKENLGKTQGSDSVFLLFGIWMFGEPDIDLAIDNALSDKGADALINVRCYEMTTWFILFSITKYKVVGDAVIFEDPGEKDDKKK